MLTRQWADFVRRQSLVEPYIFAGSQAIYPDVVWEVDAELFMNDDSMNLAEIGYTKAKINQLRRHYRNEETLERARQDIVDRMESRKYGSGVFDFRGETKKTTKQDYCLTAGVIAYYPPHGHTRITIHYRTVELIFRYRADLIFLRDVILPYFNLSLAPPDKIIFRFVNCTIHAMFFVMLLLQLKDPDAHLDKMSRLNPKLYKEVVRWTAIHLDGRYRSYATAARVQNFVNRHDEQLLRRLKRVIKRRQS